MSSIFVTRELNEPMVVRANPERPLSGPLRVRKVFGAGTFTQDPADPLAVVVVTASPGPTLFVVTGCAVEPEQAWSAAVMLDGAGDLEVEISDVGYKRAPDPLGPYVDAPPPALATLHGAGNPEPDPTPEPGTPGDPPSHEAVIQENPGDVGPEGEGNPPA